jgi:hypothetical protein
MFSGMVCAPSVADDVPCFEHVYRAVFGVVYAGCGFALGLAAGGQPLGGGGHVAVAAEGDDLSVAQVFRLAGE